MAINLNFQVCDNSGEGRLLSENQTNLPSTSGACCSRSLASITMFKFRVPSTGAREWWQQAGEGDFAFSKSFQLLIFRPYTDNKKNDWTRWMSHLLKRVDLTVSNTKFNHSKMFGTKVEFKNGEYQDPCSGDSGGPLMYETPSSKRWVIIGQLG